MLRNGFVRNAGATSPPAGTCAEACDAFRNKNQNTLAPIKLAVLIVSGDGIFLGRFNSQSGHRSR